MKKILLLLFALCLTAGVASASGTARALKVQKVEATAASYLTQSYDPAYGEYESVQSITVTFDQAVAINENKVEGGIYFQCRTAGAAYEMNATIGENSNQVVLSMDSPVTTAGNWILYIEEGVFYATSDNSIVNEETMDGAWVITGTAGGSGSSSIVFEATNVTPLPGMDTSLDVLSDIVLTFGAWPTIDDLNPSYATVKDARGQDVAQGILAYDEVDYYALHVTLDTEISEPGVYTVVIPAGAITSNDNPNAANEEMALTYRVGTFEVNGVQPEMGHVDRLTELTLFTSGRIGGINADQKVEVLMAGEVVAEGTAELGMDFNEVNIVFDQPIEQYGNYVVNVPAGLVYEYGYTGELDNMAGWMSNEQLQLTYSVGTFENTAVYPTNDAPVAQISEVTLFFSARVGGIDETKECYFQSTKDAEWKMPVRLEIGDLNEVNAIPEAPITEYGAYTLVIPEGTIYDMYYDPIDMMGASASNELIALTYQVGEFAPVATYPANDQPLEKIEEVTLFFPAYVQHIDETKEVFFVDRQGNQTPATLSQGMEPSEVVVTPAAPITEYGTYQLVIPEGTIWETYDEIDNMNGKSAEVIAILFQVGEFAPIATYPANDQPLEKIEEVTLFFPAYVQHIDETKEVFFVDRQGNQTPATLSQGMEPSEVVVTPAAPITEYGTYQLVIPEGTIWESYDEIDNMNGKSAELIAILFQVGEFAPVGAYPAPDAPLSSLSEITLFFPTQVQYLDNTKNVVFVDQQGNEFPATLDFGMEQSEVVVTPEAEIVEPGYYQLVIPEGTIWEFYDEIDNMNGKSAAEIVLLYQVGTFDITASYPAAQASVESLSEVTLFTSAPIGGFDTTKDITLTNEQGVVVAHGSIEMGMGFNEALILFDVTTTTPGVYTLFVPAGTIFDSNYDEIDNMAGAASNSDYSVSFTVAGPDGIESVTTESRQNIYDLSGRRVLNARKGLYIVNGKKVVLK